MVVERTVDIPNDDKIPADADKTPERAFKSALSEKDREAVLQEMDRLGDLHEQLSSSETLRAHITKLGVVCLTDDEALANHQKLDAHMPKQHMILRVFDYIHDVADRYSEVVLLLGMSATCLMILSSIFAHFGGIGWSGYVFWPGFSLILLGVGIWLLDRAADHFIKVTLTSETWIYPFESNYDSQEAEQYGFAGQTKTNASLLTREIPDCDVYIKATQKRFARYDGKMARADDPKALLIETILIKDSHEVVLASELKIVA